MDTQILNDFVHFLNKSAMMAAASSPTQPFSHPQSSNQTSKPSSMNISASVGTPAEVSQAIDGSPTPRVNPIHTSVASQAAPNTPHNAPLKTVKFKL